MVGLLGIGTRIWFDSTRGLVTLAVRENELRVEYLGASVRRIKAGEFVFAAILAGHHSVVAVFVAAFVLEMDALGNVLVAAACNAGVPSFTSPARAPARIEQAMALTGAPELLLLDEPTSGVSVEETFPMMDTIVEALGDEVTVLTAQSELNHSASMLDAEIRIERGANAAG